MTSTACSVYLASLNTVLYNAAVQYIVYTYFEEADTLLGLAFLIPSLEEILPTSLTLANTNTVYYSIIMYKCKNSDKISCLSRIAA